MPHPAFAKCDIGVAAAGGGKFWEDVLAGADQAANELKIKIFSRGAIGETNFVAQQRIIDHIIEKERCRGLLLAPNNADRLATVARLKQRGIPTVYIDRDIGGERVSVVKTNNAHAGILAAQAMLKELGGKGKVAVLGLTKSAVNIEIREAAFISEVTKGGLEITLNVRLDDKIGKARVTALDIIDNMHGVDAIFTSNIVATIAVLKALEQLDESANFVHIGFDSHQMFVDSIKANILRGMVIQDPFQIGYQGIYALYDVMQGKEISKTIETKSIYVDSSNINSLEVTQALRISQ